MWDATILLTSRAIGTGFLFFPSHQLYGPFILSIILILFNFASGLYSCLVMLEIRCSLKHFSNFQEIAYYLGGGRASIFFISAVVITTFALYPAYYFYSQGILLRHIIERIINLFKSEDPCDFWSNEPIQIRSRDSETRGLSMLCVVTLGYFCYSYNFQQFKRTARAISVTTLAIFVLLLVAYPFIQKSVVNRTAETLSKPCKNY